MLGMDHSPIVNLEPDSWRWTGRDFNFFQQDLSMAYICIQSFLFFGANHLSGRHFLFLAHPTIASLAWSSRGARDFPHKNVLSCWLPCDQSICWKVSIEWNSFSQQTISIEFAEYLRSESFTSCWWWELEWLQVSGIIYLVTYNQLNTRTCFDHRVFINSISTLSAIYPMTAWLSFVIHCYASSLAFELIQTEIERSEIQLLNSQHENVRRFVFAVKQRYFMACLAWNQT